MCCCRRSHQVRYAFVAGVVLTLALIPVNRYLAVKIQSASAVMMAAKDARVRIMSQALRGIRVLKMICWEPACVLAVRGA
jgi:ATP-binding cassette subfamily C (CFTR/MRP) protein 10